MDWADIQNEIRGLGFETVAQVNSYLPHIVIPAVNRSIMFVINDLWGKTGKHTITQDGTEEGLESYDLSTLTDDFLELKYVTKELDDEITPFTSYELEQDSVVVMDSSIEGKFNFFYTIKPTPITVDTSDDTEIEMPDKLIYLIALKAAYYIWLDDDKDKAYGYRSDYEDHRQKIIDKTPDTKVEIIGGYYL